MKKIKNNKGGFIQIIVVVLLIIIIGYFVGFNPTTIWVDFVYPIISSIWGVLVWIAGFLIGLINIAHQAFQNLMNLIN